MLKEMLVKLMKEEEGATAIEYALIAGLISMAIVVAAGNIGTSISNSLDEAAANLP